MNRTAHMLEGYRAAGLQDLIEGASPHALVRMMMEGALERIASARGLMTRDIVAEKGAQIGKAISIIEGLRVSLDREGGGEVAGNLERLYDYMMRRLLEANLRNEPAALDEVAGLLREVRDAWNAIPAAHRGGPPEAPGADTGGALPAAP